ncbi:MAG: hypothetical protein R3C51_13045 [Parvularculaceae bacterium]
MQNPALTPVKSSGVNTASAISACAAAASEGSNSSDPAARASHADNNASARHPDA